MMQKLQRKKVAEEVEEEEDEKQVIQFASGVRCTEGIKDVYTRSRTRHTPVIHSKNETHELTYTHTHTKHRKKRL